MFKLIFQLKMPKSMVIGWPVLVQVQGVITMKMKETMTTMTKAAREALEKGE